MQINETIKGLGPRKIDGQRIPDFKKEGSSFAELFQSLSKSLEKPLELSGQALLEGFKDLSNDTDDEHLLEMMAMMGQNPSIQGLLESLKNPDQEAMIKLGSAEEAAKSLMEVKGLNNQEHVNQEQMGLMSVHRLDQVSEPTAQSLSKNPDTLNPDVKRPETLKTDVKTADVLNPDTLRAEKGLGQQTKNPLATKEGLKETAEMTVKQGPQRNQQTKMPDELRSDFEISLKNQKLSGKNQIDENTMAGMAKTSELEPVVRNQVPDDIPVAKQIQGKILDQFDGKTPKVFKMTLNPESLGEIEVELKINHGKLVIGILSASQETHEILTKQLDQLIRGLALQKIQVETIETHRFVDETDQGQATLTNSDFNQSQSGNPNLKGNQSRKQEFFGNRQKGQSISDTLSQLSSMNKQFNRLDYRI